MTLEQIASLGRQLAQFLRMFASCFGRPEGRRLLAVYMRGQFSNLRRKNAEAIALEFGEAPRTLQRFLESIKWNAQQLIQRQHQVIASEHAHPEAIGCVDESGTVKSGKHTAGAARQYNGNRGKVENCNVAVHLSYSTPGFQVLLDSQLYLKKEWADDAARRKKVTSPRRSCFRPSHRLR